MKFRQRVEAVIEKFNGMREDLDRERRFMGKQWSKREAQILAAVDSMRWHSTARRGHAVFEVPTPDTAFDPASCPPRAPRRWCSG